MRAEIIGIAKQFDVGLEQRPDGSWAPPAKLTILYRPCFQKPPVELRLAFLYTNEEQKVAVYGEVKEL